MDLFFIIGAIVLAIALPAFIIWFVMRTPINLRAWYAIPVSVVIIAIEAYLIVYAVANICARIG